MYGTDVEIEFCPRCDISNTCLFTGNSAHRGICEAIADSASHNTQASNMLHDFRECREQQGNIGQSSRSNHPWSALWLGQKSISHSQDRILVRNRSHGGLGKKVCSIETRFTYKIT